MGQTWTSNIYEPGITYSSTMQNIETNFASLRTMLSGISAPSNPVAGTPWFDSSKYLLKIRNVANDAWLGIFHGTHLHKTFFYSNSAVEGWIIETLSSDKVVAIRGGSTYIVGGTTAGSWSVSGLTMPHYHGIFSHDHSITDGSHHHLIDQYGDGWSYGGTGYADYTWYQTHSHAVSAIVAITGTSVPTITTDSWRPLARVYTLQYIDV